ncbi:MAG: CPBP family intramembrane metalloprotease [Nitrospinaceae bacterium]|nr:CPBP family intramembrane metalloprotease [Nitrospinaceae bacterium]NIW58874.1 CPBP family intramembrane metalloprotease [Nitrospinaceae bacterium]
MHQSRNLEKATALTEVCLLAAAYYLFIVFLARVLGDVSFWQSSFSGPTQQLAAGFTRSVAAQLFFIVVLAVVIRNRTVLEALRSLRQKAPAAGWFIALAAAFIHATVLAAGWIENPSRIFDVSLLNLSLSLIPAADGFSQEVFFRGYVVLRLARDGFSRTTQVVVSGLLFGLLHWNWGLHLSAPSWLDVLSPVLGTFILGVVFAFAFQASKYRLLPVVVAHVLLIIIIQPWLGLTYLTP